MATVHKDIQCVMDTFAAIHDNLGNGYSAFLHI